MRKSLPFLGALLLLVLAVCAVPAASADPVNVVGSGDHQIDRLGAGKSVEFDWVVYNNDTSSYLLEITPILNSSSSSFEVSVAGDKPIVIDSGGHFNAQITFTSERFSSDAQVGMLVYFNMTKLDDPTVKTSVTETASVNVESLFASSGNKILGVWENTLPSPLNDIYATFGITVLLWVGIAGFIYFVLNPIVHQFTKKTKTELDDRILEVTRGPIFIIIVMFGLVDSLSILNISQEWHAQIWQIHQASLILVLAWVAFRIYDKVVIYYAEQWSKRSDNEMDDVLVPLLHKLGIVIIPLVALIAALSYFGVDATVLVAGMGVIGLVVAFAAQQTLSNFFAGLQLLMDRPFKVGDVIELDSGEICEVRKIGLRSTTLYNTADHELVILPNNDVANKKVVNYSRPDNHRSISAEVGVAYGTDVEKVKGVLLDIANNHPDVVKEAPQKPYVRLTKFNDSSIDFKLWYWVDDIKKMWRVGSEVRETIDKRFKEEGIEIPFPQSVVTFKNQPGQPGK
jgi:small-conductance mechanosensitive channel